MIARAAVAAPARTGENVITEYVLPGDEVFPEGIVADPDGLRFYVSSSKQGTIFRGRADRPLLDPWLPGGADGRTHALGLAVDGAGRLFVAGGPTGHLFAYDTATGELLARRTVPASPSNLNDMYIAGDHAYVTEAERPVVWRFALEDGDGGTGDRGFGEAEEWLDLAKFGADPDAQHYLNGIIVTPDGKTLVTAAQATGTLWRIDIATATAERIDLGGVPVNGDGLEYVGDLLYICDNTDEPDGSFRMWLTAVRLADDARTGVVAERWERTAALSPTTLAYFGGRLYEVNSQVLAELAGEVVVPPFTVTASVPPVPGESAG